MDKIRMKKDELLSILKENRKKHKQEYKEAIRAFRLKAVDTFNSEFEKAKSGKKFETFIRLDKPDSHEKEYDLTIKMLELTIDEIIELTHQEFNQLVNDEWSWKSSFRATYVSVSSYSGLSGTSGGAQGPAGCAGEVGYSNNIVFTSNYDDDIQFDVTFADDEVED